MEASITTVKTLEIVRATRDAKMNGLDIKQGQFIGLVDGELKVAANTTDEAVFQLLDVIDLARYQLMNLYFGKETDNAYAEQISSEIKKRYPHLEVGIVNGEQPYYQFIISVE